MSNFNSAICQRTSTVAMATEMDNKRRFVVLPGMNATLEETKTAYDERASFWDEVSLYLCVMSCAIILLENYKRLGRSRLKLW